MTNNNDDNQKEAVAHLRRAHMAPKKVRMVADLIRGESVNDAEAELHMSTRRPSEQILKLLRSAMANADHNHDMDVHRLYVKEIRVDEGPVFKRWEPRAQGRVGMIQKRTSHITIVLAEKEEVAAPAYNVPTPEKAEEDTEKSSDEGDGDTHDSAPPAPQQEDKMEEQPGFMDKIFRRKSV